MTDYLKRASITEFTRDEFLDFVRKVGDPSGKTEREDSRWINAFRALAQHPSGSDILFYPEPGKDSVEAMVEEVERYRREHGLPGFREG